MKLTGVFKDYNTLKTAYGLAGADIVDEEFDAFLQKIAGADCVLTNYSPLNQTFDTTLYGEDPERPGSGKMVYQYLDGRSRRYGDNMGIDKLASVVKQDADQYIFCTHCGFTIGKAVRYDYEPKFSYGDIFNGDCQENETGDISGIEISFNACIDGKMFCPQHRNYSIWDEVGNTLP